MEKQKLNWEISLQSVKNNVVQLPENSPQKDGCYLCTCVTHIYGIPGGEAEDCYKYLKVLEWSEKTHSWHVPGTNRCSDVVLAWADVSGCDFNDFKYNCGGYLTQKEDQSS